MELTPLQRLPLPCGPLAYRQTGTGTPLILIHGWRGGSSHWQNTLDQFGDIRHIHALDLPGHGATPPRRAPLTAVGLARLVIAFADQAGLEQFDLAGHSFGAAVSVAIAAQWPERVRRLVLISLGIPRSDLERLAMTQGYFWMNQMLPWWRPWLAQARPWPGIWRPWIEWLSGQPPMQQALAGGFLRQLPADRAFLREGIGEFLKTDPLSALEIAIDAGSPDFPAALARIAAPVLLLSGDQDVIMPASSIAALAGQLDACRTVILDDCGHLPMIEWPDRFHREVREFLIDSDS